MFSYDGDIKLNLTSKQAPTRKLRFSHYQLNLNNFVYFSLTCVWNRKFSWQRRPTGVHFVVPLGNKLSKVPELSPQVPSATKPSLIPLGDCGQGYHGNELIVCVFLWSLTPMTTTPLTRGWTKGGRERKYLVLKDFSQLRKRLGVCIRGVYGNA